MWVYVEEIRARIKKKITKPIEWEYERREQEAHSNIERTDLPKRSG